MTGPTIVAMGDSVTLGVGDGILEPSGKVGWGYHVACALGAASFTNLAANGTRARDLAADQLDRAIALKPDLVIVTIGGNDVLRGDFDPAEIEQTLTEALLQLRAAGARVVMSTLSEIRFFSMRIIQSRVTELMARRIRLANDAIRAANTAAGGMLIDGRATLDETGPAFWHTDKIHPSPLGHRAMAQAVVDRIAGFDVVAEIPAPPPPASRASHWWWIVRKGLPWIAKRSRDLIPQVSMVILRELAADRRAQRRAAYELRDHTGRVAACLQRHDDLDRPRRHVDTVANARALEPA